MSDEQWREFRADVRKDFEDLFNRIRYLESKSAAKDERDRSMIEKLDNLTKSFDRYSDDEAIKYSAIQGSLTYLKRFTYILIGGVATTLFFASIINWIGFDNIIKLLK